MINAAPLHPNPSSSRIARICVPASGGPPRPAGKYAAEEADLAFHIMDRRRLQLAEDVLGAALEIYVDYPEVMAWLRTAWEFGI